MKISKIIFPAFTLAFVFGLYAGAQQVPDAVKESFSNNHSQVQHAKWEKEGKYFEAEWMENGLGHAAVYDAEGKELMSKVEMDVTTLPQGIVIYIQDHFDGYEWEEAEEVTTASGKLYAIEMEKGNEEVELVFDESGNLVKQEVEHEDDGDDED